MVSVDVGLHFSTCPELMPSARLAELPMCVVLYIEDRHAAKTVLYFTDEQLQSLAVQINGIAAQQRAKHSAALQVDREMSSPADTEAEIVAAEVKHEDPFSEDVRSRQIERELRLDMEVAG